MQEFQCFKQRASAYMVFLHVAQSWLLFIFFKYITFTSALRHDDILYLSCRRKLPEFHVPPENLRVSCLTVGLFGPSSSEIAEGCCLSSVWLLSLFPRYSVV